MPRTPLTWIALLFALIVGVCFLPGVLSPEGREVTGGIASAAFRLLVAIALLSRLARSGSREPIRFWSLICMSFACWFVGDMLVSTTRSTMPVVNGMIEDGMLVLFYPFMVVAVSGSTLRRRWGVGDPNTLGLIACLLVVFAYFVVVPALWDPTTYSGFAPSASCLFVCDSLLAARALYAASVASGSVRRRCNWVGVSMAMFAFSNLIDIFHYSDVIHVASSSPLILLWIAPFIPMIAATTVDDSPTPEISTTRRRAGFPWMLVGCVVGLLTMHITIRLAGWLSSTQSERDVVAVAGVLVLACLAFLRWRSDRGRQGVEIHLFVNDEDLLQSQKMEALGRLAGGVAHDFNNLLSVVRGCSDLLENTMDPDDPSHTYIADIQSAVDRAAALTTQLLAFSRRQVLDTRAIDLNEVAREMRSLLTRVIGEDIELVMSLDREPAFVEGDASQLGQVILNLVVNARNAMPAGGRIELTTTRVLVDRVHGADGKRDHVVLTVRDTGQGMAPETRDRLFEPFYSASSLPGGTGLGLAVVHGIVRQSGGFITVDSKEGTGTRFEVFLVATEPPATASDGRDTEHDTKIPLCGQVVLLVEDEEKVRSVLAEMLRMRGLKVMEASDGHMAVRVAAAFAGSIELLLTDVVLPGMDGVTLARIIQGTRPETRVLFVSGYPDTGSGERNMPPSGAVFLKKPFTMEQLNARLGEVLAPESVPSLWTDG